MNITTNSNINSNITKNNISNTNISKVGGIFEQSKRSQVQ
jgi:hypothetical protein